MASFRNMFRYYCQLNGRRALTRPSATTTVMTIRKLHPDGAADKVLDPFTFKTDPISHAYRHNRIIFINGYITDGIANSVIAQLLALQQPLHYVKSYSPKYPPPQKTKHPYTGAPTQFPQGEPGVPTDFVPLNAALYQRQPGPNEGLTDAKLDPTALVNSSPTTQTTAGDNVNTALISKNRKLTTDTDLGTRSHSSGSTPLSTEVIEQHVAADGIGQPADQLGNKPTDQSSHQPADQSDEKAEKQTSESEMLGVSQTSLDVDTQSKEGSTIQSKAEGSSSLKHFPAGFYPPTQELPHGCTPEIRLFINSSGGDYESTIAVFDMMNSIKKTTPIYTVCLGRAYGMSSILLANGTAGKRFILANSRTSLGQFTAREGRWAQLPLYNVYIEKQAELTSLYKKLSAPESASLIDNAMINDAYLSSLEAVNFGLADGVLGNISE